LLEPPEVREPLLSLYHLAKAAMFSRAELLIPLGAIDSGQPSGEALLFDAAVADQLCISLIV
jgi:hypothetical protein